MDTLHVERSEGVVTVTFDRPRTKNALTRAMVTALSGIFADIERHAADRVLVVTGAGGDFCSGADLSDLVGPTGQPGQLSQDAVGALARVREVGDVAVALHRLSKPTIAMVEGVAVGAGCSLALGCDLVVASETARFSMIFSRRALSLDAGASWLLPRLVGMARAKEIAYFADLLDAARAAELGLVNRVVPPDQLQTAVLEWARRLADGPALALSLTKALLDGAWSVSLAQAVENEAQSQAVNLTGPDTAEALAAFAERREPRYRQI